MYCIPSNFNLSESLFSDKGYNSAVIMLYFEPQSDCQITYEEYLDSIHYSSLNLFVSNEYFDPSDMESPIKTSINDNYIHYISPRFHNRFLLNVQKNTYEIDSGGIFSEK